MNNEGLIGWMSGGEVAINASSIQWRVKSAFITYLCPLCQQMLSQIRSHHDCLTATDSSWCTYLTNNLTAEKAKMMGDALHSCNTPQSEIELEHHDFTLLRCFHPTLLARRRLQVHFRTFSRKTKKILLFILKFQ